MKQLGIIVVILVLLGFGFLFFHGQSTPDSNTRELISTVTYNCDNNHTITAMYYEGPEVESQPGEPPVPTGSVDISLDGGDTATFAQTISASGVRYADDDEAFVFWSKGEEALVMRRNEMDTTYRNCFDSASERPQDTVTTTPAPIQYPEFSHEYISATDWPPQIEQTDTLYDCSEGEERTINETTYCINKSSEGAAGSTYTTYTYAREGSRIVFTLQFPQCLNYDQPEQDACLEEQKSFNADEVVAGIVITE